jgi:hypothetical protein
MEGKDIPANVVYIYGFLITYNLLKKPLPLLEKFVEVKNGSAINKFNAK